MFRPSVLLGLLFLLAAAEAGRCSRDRWRDSDCPIGFNNFLDSRRVISPAEYRIRACCARRALIDPEDVVFVEPRLVESSSARDTPLVPNVYNPYEAASVLAIAGKRAFVSAAGSWDTLTGAQQPEGVERVNWAYDWMFRAAGAAGLTRDDAVQYLVLAKGTNAADFANYRTRANNVTLSSLGFLQGRFPGREFIGALAVEGVSPSDPNTFTVVGEFYLGCSGFELWNLPCNVTQSIPTIVTQTPETEGFLTNRIRPFIINGTLANGCPNWVSPPLADRTNVAWDNIITREGVYLNQQPAVQGKIVPGRVARIEIWAVNFALSLPDTLAKIQQYFTAPYPALRYMNVPALATGDIYELGLTYWTGPEALVYNTQTPFAPLGPYSNAVRSGDYIYTSSFGGHNSSGQLVPLEQRVLQAFDNMLAAGRALGGADARLFQIEAITTSLARDQAALVAAIKLRLGAGPYPTRTFSEQPGLYLGETFEISGMFYDPLCRRW